MTNIKAVSVLGMATMLLVFLAAECSWGAIGPEPLALPNLSLYTNGSVTAAALAPDGSIVFGGTFTSVNGVPRQNIARLMPDGTLDPTWDPSADNTIWALAVDIDGSVYAGGWFTNIGGQQRTALAKVSGTQTGKADPTWIPSYAGTGYVYALALDGQGSVFAGGDFVNINGQSYITKLSTTGGGVSDTQWLAAADSAVTALATGPLNTIYAGGNFTTIGGLTRAGIAKLSTTGTGAADSTWNPGVDNTVRALAVGSDGSVYAGGYFVTVAGASHAHIVKLSGSGAGLPDAAWSSSADSDVYVLTLNSSGDLYVGGDFYIIGGQARHGIAKLPANGNGAADAGWNAASNNDVAALLASNDGQICAGGYFTNIGGQDRRGMAMLSTSAQALSPVDAELPGVVWALAKQPNGGIVVGGEFFRAGPYARANLLRIQPDGTLDPNWAPAASSDVLALTVGNDSAVYAGGTFYTINGTVTGAIAKINADSTGTLNWPTSGMIGEVHALALDSGGSLYAGGVFTSYGSTVSQTLAKFAPSDGHLDTTWNPNTDGFVLSLVLDGSGDLFIGGNFSNVNGQPRQNLAKLALASGTLDTSWSPQPDGSVGAITVGDNGSLYAGGEFQNIGGATRSFVAKLSTVGTGAADSIWNPMLAGNYYDSGVRAMATDPMGGLIIGGRFDSVGTSARANLARVSAAGAGDPDPTWNPQTSGGAYEPSVDAVAQDGLGNIYIGGEFTTVGNQARTAMTAVPLDYIFANGFE